MNHWPSFYHPSTVVFVDDEKIFLDALVNRMLPDFSCKIFTNPIEALKIILNSKSKVCSNLEHSFLLDDALNESDSDIVGIGLRWDSFIKPIYDTSRFEVLSVVIVDYMMPELNGIEFCRRLKDSSIKKIMLTANADHSMAVKAFNDGIIDGFLVKDSPNLFVELTEKIDSLQKKYFNTQIEQSLGGVLKNIHLDPGNEFVDFYGKIRKQLGAIEYYPLDRFGSVLFIDRDGTPATLAVCPINELKIFSQIADDQDEKDIANKLREFEKILFFPNQTDCMLPAACWGNFMHSAKFFPGIEDLIYAIIKDPICQPVDIKKIQSKSFYEKISRLEY